MSSPKPPPTIQITPMMPTTQAPNGRASTGAVQSGSGGTPAAVPVMMRRVAMRSAMYPSALVAKPMRLISPRGVRPRSRGSNAMRTMPHSTKPASPTAIATRRMRPKGWRPIMEMAPVCVISALCAPSASWNASTPGITYTIPRTT